MVFGFRVLGSSLVWRIGLFWCNGGKLDVGFFGVSSLMREMGIEEYLLFIVLVSVVRCFYVLSRVFVGASGEKWKFFVWWVRVDKVFFYFVLYLFVFFFREVGIGCMFVL